MTSNSKQPDLRSEIDCIVREGRLEEAADLLAELWRNESNSASAAFICSRFEKLREWLPLVRLKLAILRSFTVEPIVPLLRAAAFCNGIDVTVHVGDFNAYAQEILDPTSSVYKFIPDTLLLAVRTAEIAPDLWQSYVELSSQAVQSACERTWSSYEQWVRALREYSQANVIIHNLEQPIRPAFGTFDAQSKPSQSEAIHEINRELRRVANEHRGVYVLDYDGLVARYGRVRWHDERKYLTARLPISAENLIHLAREWLRFLTPLSGKIAKVLVADLDETLWGGVIGEDGIMGINVGPEYPGVAYQALQRVLLDLSKRGVLLAICSKNNPEDAIEVLEKHPGMLLRPKDVAAMRISWDDKAQGIREIAAELNIGIDSLAFLDDNPFERQQVRASLPEVLVIDLPKNFLDYASTLRDCPAFERLTLSPEDLQRATMYKEQRTRSHAEQDFRSKEDFYRFLEQETEIAPVTPETLSRVAQLTQKTNQFNLTTRRYTEQQIMEASRRLGWQVLSIRVCDRFGDHGIVGVAITCDEGDVCEIDSFLLSCRVIGRTVETVLLSCLAQGAASRGRSHLRGRFVPTKKNSAAREFYPRHGFELITSDNGEGALWSFDLRGQEIPCPEWTKLKIRDGAHN